MNPDHTPKLGHCDLLCGSKSPAEIVGVNKHVTVTVTVHWLLVVYFSNLFLSVVTSFFHGSDRINSILTNVVPILPTLPLPTLPLPH